MSDDYFAFNESIELQKDELAKFNISGKTLFFRWTLFVNKVLYMHYKFDGWVNQNILINAYRKNGFKIYFKQKSNDFTKKPYMMIVFKGMKNDQNTTAVFNVYVYDPTSSVKVKRN